MFFLYGILNTAIIFHQLHATKAELKERKEGLLYKTSASSSGGGKKYIYICIYIAPHNTFRAKISNNELLTLPFEYRIQNGVLLLKISNHRLGFCKCNKRLKTCGNEKDFRKLSFLRFKTIHKTKNNDFLLRYCTFENV